VSRLSRKQRWMFPDDSETRTDERGARGGALGRDEQGEELEERGRSKMEAMTEAYVRRG
jgi:hypothetical protein